MTARRRIPNAFAVVTVSILLTIAITYWFGRDVLESRDEVRVHHENIALLEALLSSVTEAESGQRGYLLTDDETYLAPYHKALAQIPVEIDAIRQRPLSPSARAGMTPMNNLIRQKFDELRLTINTRHTEGPVAALAIVQANHGKNLMDDIRAKIAGIESAEDAAVWTALAHDNTLTHWRTGIFIAASLLNLWFLYWASRVIQREIKLRDEAVLETRRERDEVRRQKDLLNITLASIGDCVIVTDARGAITFMNEVAREVTGWSAEAIGAPLAGVFRIINEQTREPVESPVEKVLRLGKIVGLANHTLLIRKDGAEVPIDDSGAPIREPDGTILGVVLVFRDFSEHKKWEISLEEARQAAEAANRAKDQFLAMLSHELRTPLTPILATLSLWEIDGSIPEALNADVAMIRHNVELEARLIDDLLDLTRIAKGVLHLNLETENLHTLLESVVAMYSSEIHTKRLGLKLELKAREHFARVDAARVQQIFWNLLKNATKFTEESGAITISTENDRDGEIVITFADTGIGMSGETLQRLFLPFEQGEHHLSHRYGGLGLGLAITKSLTEALGGKITAASNGPGQGSCFTLEFATAQPPANTDASGPDGEDGAKAPGKSLQILLMEDHAHTAQAMARLLTRRGHQVSAVASMKSARELLAEKTFDLLLCDLGLPDGNGVDFLQETRKTSQIPAVALSGFGMEEDVARCEQAGFFAHLTKPIDIPRLEAIIEQLSQKG